MEVGDLQKVWEVRALKTKPDAAAARATLDRVARQVQPIMRRHAGGRGLQRRRRRRRRRATQERPQGPSPRGAHRVGEASPVVPLLAPPQPQRRPRELAQGRTPTDSQGLDLDARFLAGSDWEKLSGGFRRWWFSGEGPSGRPWRLTWRPRRQTSRWPCCSGMTSSAGPSTTHISIGW